MEMAFDCFERFKEDKNLDSWHLRVMGIEAPPTSTPTLTSTGSGPMGAQGVTVATPLKGPSGGTTSASTSSSASSSSSVSFSIMALDFLLTQMAALRDMVHQYYAFLNGIFTARFIVAAEQVLSAGYSDGAGAGSGHSNTPLSPQAIAAAASAEVEQLCTTGERNKWREVDAVYASLEFGYLAQAVREALAESSLLEIEGGQGSSSNGSGSGIGAEGGGCVLVPQAVEDVFFVLRR
jgi:hypothetical protein